MKKIFHGITTSLALVLLACETNYNTTNEYTVSDAGLPQLELDAGEAPMPRNLTRSFLSVMKTTTYRLGSFAGNQVPNLQIDQLDPGEYTIEFSVVEPPIDGQDFACYAYVVWKVDGQQIQRIVNVFSGAVISGVAEAVDVYLLDQSARGITSSLPNASVVNGSPIITYGFPVTLAKGQVIVFNTAPQRTYTVLNAVTNSLTVTIDQPYGGPTSGLVGNYSISDYKVGATLSRGSRPTIMQPPTLATDTIAIIASVGPPQSFNIPQDAGIISVLVTVTAGVGAQSESLNGWVDFVDLGGSLILGNYVPNYFSGWFPVPVGAATLRMHNESVTATLQFAVQWGIEG